MTIKNYYRRLGVGLHASPDEVKRGYHREARREHPDTGTGTTAGFVEIQEAYNVLSDPKRRAEYDEKREQWARLNGAFICLSCATPNFVPRRPRENEHLICSHCRAALPLDLSSAIALQKQRLIATAARIVDDVGADLASTMIDVARVGLKNLRNRLTRSK